MDNTDIKNRLVSCLNRMLKKDLKNTNVSTQRGIKNKIFKNDFLDFTADDGETKYLPHKSLYSNNLDEDIDVQKIYYGKCLLYINKYIPDGECKV